MEHENPNQPAQSGRQDATATPGGEQRDPNSILYGSAQPGQPVMQTPAQKAMAGGGQGEPRTVKMNVLRDGSFGGAYHHAGDSVDVDEQYVETLTQSGFAVRADHAERAKQDRDFAEQTRQAGRKAAGKSTTVKPLGTQDVPGAQPAGQSSQSGQQPPAGDQSGQQPPDGTQGPR